MRLEPRVLRHPNAAAALLVALACSMAGPALAAEETFSLEGIWQGWIVYAEAEIELDFLVEIARDANGKLVGSIDVPSQKMEFYPLTSASLAGREVAFDFHRDSERTKNAHFFFTGELAADGTKITGMFKGWADDDGRNRVPFTLERTGDATGERAPVPIQPLLALSPTGEELVRAFNAKVDKARLVLLLSPT